MKRPQPHFKSENLQNRMVDFNRDHIESSVLRRTLYLQIFKQYSSYKMSFLKIGVNNGATKILQLCVKYFIYVTHSQRDDTTSKWAPKYSYSFLFYDI